MRRTRRPSPFSSSSDIVMKKHPSFSTVTEPTYSSGPRGGQVLDDEVSSTEDSASHSREFEVESMSLTHADMDIGDDDTETTNTSSNSISNSNSNSGVKVTLRSNTDMLANAGELAIEDADDSMLLPSLRNNTDIRVNTKTHVKMNQKHKSLGAIPMRHLSTPNSSGDGLLGTNGAGGQRRAGGLRHLSLMRKERDRDARYGRATPSFLDSIVRSVSPTPQMLSSDPTKIIGAQSLRSASAKKSFSLDSFGQRSRPKQVTEAFRSSAKTSDSLAWRPSGNSTAYSLSPSNSRSSGIDALGNPAGTSLNGDRIGTGHGYTIPKSPRSQNLSSTSLRRVLSLGRPRLDSDAYSAISEPIVYADSAHVADDIWIAPKELYEVERRLAASVEKRKKEKEEIAMKLAEKRKISHLNRNIEITSVHPEKPRSVIANGNIQNSVGGPVRYSFRTTTPDSSSINSLNTLHGVRKYAESSTAANSNGNSSNNNVDSNINITSSTQQHHVDLMDIDEPSQTNLVRAMRNGGKSPGGADRHSSLPSPAPPAQPDYQDPTEFNNADMSSRLIKLFFNSGSQNPMPPSTVKRNADLQSRSAGGSSRRLLFRKLTGNSTNGNCNNVIGDRHISHSSHMSHMHSNSGTLRIGASGRSSASNMKHHPPHQDPRHGNIHHHNININVNPNVESMSHDFDLKGRMRGIARLANVRRWLRSRAYRKRRPERRPREVPV